MELRHLRYFVTVAELLNFTKAAAKLRVAQPSFSRQIRDLEEELGVPLLERNSRFVRLTEAGKAFATEARAVSSTLRPQPRQHELSPRATTGNSSSATRHR